MKKTALIFPGQGSQYEGMGKNLYEESVVAKQIFDEANDILGFDLKKLCLEGTMEELTKTENAQPAILTTSVATYKVYMEQIGIKPEFMAGHSLGEYSALTCAGVIKFADALKLVRKRGGFMQEAVPLGVGSMSAVSGVSVDVLEEECTKFSKDGEVVVISNYNSPEQLVISGDSSAVKALGEKLTQMGAIVIPLKVSAPFHCPLMQPAADKMKEELSAYKYNDFEVPVISNVTARPYFGKDEIVEKLSEQIVKPVRWLESMRYFNMNGIDIAIEIGPQTVLKKLMQKNVPTIKAFSYEKKEDVEELKNIFRPSQKKDGAYLIGRCLAIAVCTKNNNWNNEEYEKGVILPYKNIQRIMEEIETKGVQPTSEQIEQIIKLTRTIMDTKKVPEEEQKIRFSQLVDETGAKEIQELLDIELNTAVV